MYSVYTGFNSEDFKELNNLTPAKIRPQKPVMHKIDIHSMPTKRPQCSFCHRPQKTCLCHLVKKVHNQCELIIWQHPSEQHHPKGSAQLLHLCFSNSRLHCRDRLSAEELKLDLEHCVLLYPKDEQSNSPETYPRSIKQLLLLDATWRKSRLMLYTNPWLATLPRMSLLTTTDAQYRIRKAENPQQLSSFEAGALAISELDGQPYFEQSLKGVFEGFVCQWESFLPNGRGG